jgi:glycosyltransferase involved in cell wall biosynthesis
MSNESRQPLVSIVTPSFQQACYLRRCIESVINQDYPCVEYMVFDGGSSDGSVEILKSYGNRFRWQSASDGGQAAAVNAGLRQSNGEIVGFLNSDDWLAPEAISSAVNALLENPQADVVYGETMIVDERGDVVRPFPTREFSREIFVQHCFISQPAAFWRRSLHDRFGYFSPEFDHTLDYDFWLRLMCGGVRFRHLQKIWAYASEHPAAKTQRLRGEIFRQIRDLQLRHLGYCGRNWWEQYLRYLRDERGGIWNLLPGGKSQRLYRLAWFPYIFWRRRLGGPLFYREGDWRV